MDIAVLLVAILVVAMIVRGPKTLPSIGRAFGQGVREARRGIDGSGDKEDGQAGTGPRE